MNPYTKTFVASGDLSHRALVKFTANDGEVALATAPTDLIAGVVDYPNGAKSGGRVDVVLFGPAEVLVGGTVLPGAGITADGTGRAIAAAPGAGINHFVVGRVLTNGVVGDIAKAFINPHRIQG
ncbi:hypothetical protein [Rhizobium sp. Leaf341]|uniref:hypothetical protein n=1 Tax=Rhizobium sp. Leaf341 TaxID=1736344 RepID=UPI0007162EB9|nr:hypothetical protein [Rhizobium sp. Leaf341]KQR75755.1 hypothetical protein ASG03_18970 [Rhizobium sp. Leaf341]